MEKSVDEIFQMIVLCVEEMSAEVDHGPITRASMLSPLGLDSIGRVLLIERMVEALGITGPRFEFFQASNLGELAEIFAMKVNGSIIGLSREEKAILLEWNEGAHSYRDLLNGSAAG